ncbi:PAS domain-containing sensor histidine kinase [Cupriavidus necator]|uniref:PAS domain-containing sensor histidine kinase n=1 Tax=Cupriavidus necator TaxID=106590 RepID=UPI0005B39920|nr:PAS domain S-box protein [Cupriavidus necator]
MDVDLQRAILNNIPDQAWLKDVGSRYILVNDAFMAACGRTEAEILGRTPDQVWSEEWGQVYLRTDKAVVASGIRRRYEESRHARDGSLRWFDTIKMPVRGRDGEVVGTVGISRDITDRKRSEQALLAEVEKGERTRQELLASRAQLRELSAYLQSVREAERTRISRELHDELGQSLTALRLGLSFIEAQQGSDADEACRKHVQMLKEIADSTVEAVQRIAADLRPPLLDELGLNAAIEWLAESLSERERGGITCELALHPVGEISAEVSTAVFRIAQEALTNACRHGRADRVLVELSDTGGVLRLVVSDNGRGIDASKTGHRRSLGLVGMRERALMLGGKLAVTSEKGGGTRVEAQIPNTGCSGKGGTR